MFYILHLIPRTLFLYWYNLHLFPCHAIHRAHTRRFRTVIPPCQSYIHECTSRKFDLALIRIKAYLDNRLCIFNQYSQTYNPFVPIKVFWSIIYDVLVGVDSCRSYIVSTIVSSMPISFLPLSPPNHFVVF